MRLTPAQIESMQEDMTADMLSILMEDRNMPMQEAMLLFYNSDTYARLQDAESGLYYQSPGYVLDCLDNELTTGRCF
ncbi:MAG: hypothetical protein Q4E68_08490 [Prevotellaceae bacterium]|nr:hypothetical protein [Prevotellaceae bacterium]